MTRPGQDEARPPDLGAQMALVIRFTAYNAADARAIHKLAQSAIGALPKPSAEAWMCTDTSLDTLNVTLTELGWPPQ